MEYMLIRAPSTQEDEGRHFLIDTAKTLEEARTKRDQWESACNHYFTLTIYKKVG